MTTCTAPTMTILPGTKVRFHGKYLKNTGQQRGTEGTKRWTVITDCGFGPKCLCSLGRHIAVDELVDSPEMYSDIVSSRADGKLMRHIAVANLQVIGAPPKASEEPKALIASV